MNCRGTDMNCNDSICEKGPLDHLSQGIRMKIGSAGHLKSSLLRHAVLFIDNMLFSILNTEYLKTLSAHWIQSAQSYSRVMMSVHHRSYLIVKKNKTKTKLLSLWKELLRRNTCQERLLDQDNIQDQFIFLHKMCSQIIQYNRLFFGPYRSNRIQYKSQLTVILGKLYLMEGQPWSALI